MNGELPVLHAEIDARVRSITEAHDWPCRKGCDACCRTLGAVPRLTPAEWELLSEGLAELPAAVREEVGSRARTLDGARPVVCPMLDRVSGACLVYRHRPVACRTYGFYVERDRGLYCAGMEESAAAGQWSEVVWGNAAAVDARMRAWGEARDLREWFGGQ